MHEIVTDQFEMHLRGEASEAFHAHLAACRECRTEVEEMVSIIGLMQELKPEPEASIEPPLGFYNRLTHTIVAEQKSQAWGFFSPGVPFFRRVAFASLLLLAGLGSYLVTRETGDNGPDPAAIMAQHDHSASQPESLDRERLLVTLATYHE